MKKVLFTLALFIVSFAFIACSDDDDDKKISEEDLPQVSRTFLQTHFKGEEVRLVEEDNDSYDVYLINGFKIEFNRNGEWDDIDGGTKAIPETILALLPDGIVAYVSENYADKHITEVNKEHYGYEIEVNNGLELKFDSEGKFIGIDK